jgi:dTDP-4-dehydrorhamnose reductase
LEKSLDRLKNDQEILGFDDQWFSPVSIYNLADLLAEVIVQRPRGILHLGGPERLSKYQFLQQLAASFGYSGSLVKANSFAGHKFQAPRPRDASLDISLARSILKTGVCSAAESFEQIKDKLK